MTLVGLVFTIAAFVWGIIGYRAATLANQLSQRESCRMHPVRSQTRFPFIPDMSQHDAMLQATPLCQKMRETLDYDQLSKRESLDVFAEYPWSSREGKVELRQAVSEHISLLGAPLGSYMIACFEISRALFCIVLSFLQAA
jgi:hypothetical protein